MLDRVIRGQGGASFRRQLDGPICYFFLKFQFLPTFPKYNFDINIFPQSFEAWRIQPCLPLRLAIPLSTRKAQTKVEIMMSIFDVKHRFLAHRPKINQEASTYQKTKILVKNQ